MPVIPAQTWVVAMKVNKSQEAIEVSCIGSGCDKTSAFKIPERGTESNEHRTCNNCGTKFTVSLKNFSDPPENEVSVNIYA